VRTSMKRHAWSGKRSCGKQEPRVLAQPGEHAPRNAQTTAMAVSIRDMATTSGPMEDMNMPRDCAGAFQTHGLSLLNSRVLTGSPGYVCPEPEPRRWVTWSVSWLTQSLTDHGEAWRVRPLLTRSHILPLDGIHGRVRHGDTADSTIMVTALGGDLEGRTDALALCACAEEDTDGGRCLFHDLRTRGVATIDRSVTDGQEGPLAAVTSLFPATPRQRDVAQTLRTVRHAVATAWGAIWKQETQEDALLTGAALQAKGQKRSPEARRSVREVHLLTVSAGPPVIHRSLRRPNAMERVFSTGRPRTDQMDAFPTDTRCLTIVWAAIPVPRIPVSSSQKGKTLSQTFTKKERGRFVASFWGSSAPELFRLRFFLSPCTQHSVWRPEALSQAPSGLIPAVARRTGFCFRDTGNGPLTLDGCSRSTHRGTGKKSQRDRNRTAMSLPARFHLVAHPVGT